MRGGSRTAATSKVEIFVIIVDGWKLLTIITKSSTLDVAAVLDPPTFSCNNAKDFILNIYNLCHTYLHCTRAPPMLFTTKAINVKVRVKNKFVIKKLQ